MDKTFTQTEPVNSFPLTVFLLSDYVYPYTDGFQYYACPDSSGVTMDANLDSNQVQKISYLYKINKPETQNILIDMW